MVITLTRSGGFTGIPQKKTIDTSKLPTDKCKEIEELVAKTNLTNPMPEFSSAATKSMADKKANSSKPDMFSYTITIQKDTVIYSFPVHEESLEPEMQKLITCLQNL